MSNQFRNRLGCHLLGHTHPVRQFRDAAIRLDEVLDDVAVALANVFESGARHACDHKLIYTQPEKQCKVAQVELG